MSEDPKRLLADIEAELDDEELSQVRFGRNRFLRLMGLGLFGFAAGALGLAATEEEADARTRRKHHRRHRRRDDGGGGDGRCGTSPRCSSCAGSNCTADGCEDYDAGCTGDNDGINCWFTADGTCCDYLENGSPCHCGPA
jgi:hypothetical protein